MHLAKLLAVSLLLGCFGLSAQAVSAKVIKVLPHLLDREGRHTLSPSLYERDAYQARLRQHAELRGGLRFDVQWKGRHPEQLKLVIELRGAKGKEPTSTTLQTVVRRSRLFSKWSSVELTGKDYEKFGDLVAWRASLWDGSTLLAEQRSFLW